MVEIIEYDASVAKLKALVYGVSGVGKTRFGATAPKPIYISAEGGLLSVRNLGVSIIEIKSLGDLQDAYKILEKMDHGFETVVVDSLTEIQQCVINNITGGTRMPNRGEWSDFTFAMKKLLRAFRDLPMHVIFLCLEAEKEDGDTDRSRFTPDLYGKLSSAACGFMDFVGRMSIFRITEDDKVTEKRLISFTCTDRWIAKDRSDNLPQTIGPDFGIIMKETGAAPKKKKAGVKVQKPKAKAKAKAKKKTPPPKECVGWTDNNAEMCGECKTCIDAKASDAKNGDAEQSQMEVDA